MRHYLAGSPYPQRPSSELVFEPRVDPLGHRSFLVTLGFSRAELGLRFLREDLRQFGDASGGAPVVGIDHRDMPERARMRQDCLCVVG